MNAVFLCGRLTRDPEIRYSQDTQTGIARYTLAVDRPKDKNGETQTDFINCIAFGKRAEFTEKYLRKGTKILVEGRIQTGSYKNKDGQTVHTTDVIVNTQEFAESKNGSGSSAAPKTEPVTDDGSGFMTIPDGVEDSGLPFK